MITGHDKFTKATYPYKEYHRETLQGQTVSSWLIRVLFPPTIGKKLKYTIMILYIFLK